jgi:hypothetical protein
MKESRWQNYHEASVKPVTGLSTVDDCSFVLSIEFLGSPVKKNNNKGAV